MRLSPLRFLSGSISAAGLAVVGVMENVNIRAGKKYKPRPRS